MNFKLTPPVSSALLSAEPSTESKAESGAEALAELPPDSLLESLAESLAESGHVSGPASPAVSSPAPLSSSSPASPASSPIASEDAFLDLLNRYFPNRHAHMLLGRGDDCAELFCPPKMCMTSDLFLEDVHFRTSYFSYAEIGYKALAVNLSDIAACGGVPLGFNMNLILPTSTSAKEVEALLQGMAELAAQYNLPLTGGDLSQGQKLGICISIWGKPALSNFLRRGTCQPGDTIFLLAAKANKGLKAAFPLGLARVGLLALEKWGRKEAEAQFPIACATHLRPHPLLEQGQALANFLDAANDIAPNELTASIVGANSVGANSVTANSAAGNSAVGNNAAGNISTSSSRLLNKVSHASVLLPRVSLMDLSDGLARDLPRLLGWQGNASDLGADINLSKADLPDELLRYCHTQGLNPQEQAMLGGEDYLLLGATNQPEILCKIEAQGLGQSLILGKVLAPPEQGIKLNGKPWQVKGFDHFAK